MEVYPFTIELNLFGFSILNISFECLIFLYFSCCRIKALQIEPYTQEEAERAAGMGSYIAPKSVHVETQPSGKMDLTDG